MLSMLTINPSYDGGALAPGAQAFDAGALNIHLDELAKRLWPEPPADEEIDAVVRPVQWLLTQAGADGFQLTQDGYLKPAVVSQTVSELGWD